MHCRHSMHLVRFPTWQINYQLHKLEKYDTVCLFGHFYKKNIGLAKQQNMMNASVAVYRGLKLAGIDFATSVPCVNLQKLLNLVSLDPNMIHVPVTREEEGVGICAGAWMGGRRPVLLMQNSGLGNCINALASLDFLYKIPLLMIISHRGGEGEPIVGQVPMGRLTTKLLDCMDIPSVSPSPIDAEEMVAKAWDLTESMHRPVAVLLDLGFWREI